MRIWLIALTVLLAGCSGSSSEAPSTDEQPNTNDDDSGSPVEQEPEPEAPSADGWFEVFVDDRVEVPVSFGTPETLHEYSPWIMGYGADSGTFSRDNLTGMYLEISFNALPVTLGALWGTSGENLDMTVFGNVLAWGTESAGEWIPAAGLPDGELEWFVSAASEGVSPMAAADAIATVAVTAFYDMPLPDGYSALV